MMALLLASLFLQGRSLGALGVGRWEGGEGMLTPRKGMLGGESRRRPSKGEGQGL